MEQFSSIANRNSCNTVFAFILQDTNSITLTVTTAEAAATFPRWVRCIDI